MTVSVQSFTNAFPEFRKTDAAEIQSKIAFAEQRINRTVWGGKADQGVMYLTAHLLSTAASGKNSKLRRENRVTNYELEYDKLKKMVTFGFRTAGQAPTGFQNNPDG